MFPFSPSSGIASSWRPVQTSRKDSMARSDRLLGPLSASSLGLRLFSPKPSRSPPCLGATAEGSKVVWLLAARLAPNCMVGSSGNSLVLISTAPPEKSPGLYGVAVFVVTIVWLVLCGRMSDEGHVLCG